MTKTYTVTAKRWKRGWELHIDGVGVTQVKRLNDAEAMVRDYISLDLDVAPDSFDVEIAPQVSPEVDREIKVAKAATEEAERAQESAAARTRKVADSLKDEGLSGREIAEVLKVSPQRVSQILKPNVKSGRSMVSGKVTRGAAKSASTDKKNRTGRGRNRARA